MAQQGRELLGHLEEMAIIPLMIFSQQISEWSRVFCPEVLADSSFLEESPIKVEPKDATEQVHTLILGRGLQEVVVRMCSKQLQVANLLIAHCLVVKSGLVGGPGVLLNKLAGQVQR